MPIYKFFRICYNYLESIVLPFLKYGTKHGNHKEVIIMKQTSGKLSLRRALVTGGILTLGLGVLLAGLIACNKKDPDKTTTTQNGTQQNPVVASGPYFSPSTVAVSEDGQWLYVGGTTDEAIYQYSTADNSLKAVYETDSPVNNITVSGGKVYAGMGKLGGKLVVLSSDLKEVGSVVVGHTPNDIVVKGNIAYVANRFSNTVSVVDLSSMTETKEIAVSREPMALALAGDKVYVACHLPEDAASADSVSARVSVIDTKKNEATDPIVLCNGAGNVKDIVASPDGKTLYVSHLVARYTYPTTQLDAGWANTNAVSVIDVASNKASYAFLLDDVERGACNPWGLALNDKGNVLYVAISGSSELVRVDLKSLSTLVSRVGTNTGLVDSKEDIVDYIPFASNCKKRIDLGGEGARAIAISGDTVYCAQYFSGDIAAVSVASSNMKVAATISAGPQPEADAVRLGEALWYDSTICYQNWQSCASCHPDARSGGFNWDELGDGMGTMKQTKSMLYTLRTPPCLVTGLEPNGEHAVGGSVAGTPLFNADNEEITKNILSFLTALMPEQSPYLNDDGTLTESATRGKALFEEYGCVTCHPAPLYTDMQTHPSIDLENDPSWESHDMDTSTLIEIWRTYPWGYLGDHTDLTEYVKYNVSKMGKTISDKDAEDLANFVLSIGAEGEQYGAIQVKNKDGSYNKLKAGQNIVSLSVIKQAADAPDATVTLTLYDKDGKQLDTESKEIKGLKYGTYKTLDVDITVPSDLAKGAYYVVSFKSADGTALATDLKIILN